MSMGETVSDLPPLTIPHPLVWPFGLPITAGGVQDVWDCFVKPDQDAGNPQSVEMRLLMAILRAVAAGLEPPPDPDQGSLLEV